MDFNFLATDIFDQTNLTDTVKFVENFQTVILNDENELKLLFQMMMLNEIVEENLKSDEFSKYWDISSVKLPEFNKAQFDKFYETWIEKSGRKNTMDEYGNLIFLCGLSSKWNKLKYRLVVK